MWIKINTFLIILFALFNHIANAQTADEYGNSNAFGLVYTNFHHELSKNEESGTAFEIRRAYMGVKRDISKHFKAEIKLDIGSPGDVSNYSLLRRFAYFKTAAIFYQNSGISFGFGLLDMEQFKLQERFWGYRYIYKSFQDEQQYGHSSDIGAFAGYKFSDNYSADVYITNGEGASRTQNDKQFKYSFGFTAKPIKGFTTRIYADLLKKETNGSTVSLFTAYKLKNKWRIGLEGVYKLNEKDKKGFNRYGGSVFSSLQINPRWACFARYDLSLSNIPKPFTTPWNLDDDGSAMILGFEFKAHERVNLSLNYQDWFPYANNLKDTEYLFFNIEFSL